METTVKAAIGSADGIISPSVNSLIRGVLRAMLLKKMSTIAITVVAGLALATGAGVLAQQARSLPNGDEPDGQRAGTKSASENQSGNAALSTADDMGESKEQEDESIDRIELLRLDVELLHGEVQARINAIQNANGVLIQAKLEDKSDANQSQIESLQKSLEHFRKVYLLKKKELTQKQLELEELNEIERKRYQEKYQRAEALKAEAPNRYRQARNQNGEVGSGSPRGL